MVCRRPLLMAWDDDEVEIERSPFMALRGLVPPSSSTTNARRTDPLELVPEAGLQPRMPEPQPHKCTSGVKPDGQEDRQPRAYDSGKFVRKDLKSLSGAKRRIG